MNFIETKVMKINIGQKWFNLVDINALINCDLKSNKIVLREVFDSDRFQLSNLLQYCLNRELK